MSALSHRSHMLEFLKNIFQRRSEKNHLLDHEPLTVADAPHPAPKPPSMNEPPSRPRPVARDNGNGAGNGNSVEVSLQNVFAAFPPELKTRIKQSDVGEATVSVPMDKVLAQLSLGVVKISFGELRRAAPQLFSPGSESDQVLVRLPLNEILQQVRPDLLGRRQNQKHIEIPEEIRSPFGNGGDGLIFSVGPAKTPPPAVAPPPARAITPALPTSPVMPSPVAPAQFAPRPAPPAPHIPPAPATHYPQAPALPPSPGPVLSPLHPIPFRGSIGSSPTPPPQAARPAGSPPTGFVPPALRGVGAVNPLVSPIEPAHPRAPIVPREASAPAAKASPETPPLFVPLVNLAESWPEALRREIAQLNLVDAKVALPAEMIEQTLKRGRVAFSWKVLRSWIKPAPLPTVSVHDNAMLDLPLKVIAPLFLNRQQETGKSHQKVAIDENIPNLFFGFPQPESPAAPAPPPASHLAVTKPVDTNYYVWEEPTETPKPAETEFKRKPEASPGTTFVNRYATPNEVVSRAAALDGVAGALIALPDGLMVASRLSSDLNGDTLAAFLPQIFGKVSQCTKELRMGELNNLNFTVGNVPWKIFRVNAIFFAAFGRPGQPLPTGQLASLAAELDRKKQ